MLGRIGSFIVATFVLALALWLSLTLFAVLFFLGFLAAVFFWLRAYLLEKEILNPQPGVHIETMNEQVTVIEGDYEELKNDDR